MRTVTRGLIDKGRAEGRAEARIEAISELLSNGGTKEDARRFLKATDAEIEQAESLLVLN